MFQHLFLTGPKIDIKVRDCMGRQHQCATVQLDFQLPIRFDLKYSRVKASDAAETKDDTNKADTVKADTAAVVDEMKKDVEKEKRAPKGIYKNLPNSTMSPGKGYERPVMVHRAMLGSVERMFAILVEHYGGNFPLWLSPRQVMIVPVHRDFEEHCQKVQLELREKGIFVDVDLSRRTMKKSIREAQVQGKYNYIVVIGRDEMEANTVSVRARGAADETRGVPVADFLKDMLEKIQNKTADPPPTEVVKGGKGKGDAKGGKGGGKGKKGKAAPNTGSDWSKTDIRVGHIVKAWKHPDSEKLWCEEIDIGEEKPRQIASGLREFYPNEEQMTGRKCLVVCNLKPAKLGGFKSEGMVLCAGNAEHTAVEFVDVPEGAKIGERVFIEGDTGDPIGPGSMKKKKIFDKLSKDLKTNAEKIATWQGKPIMTSAGPCTVPSLADVFIK